MSDGRSPEERTGRCAFRVRIPGQAEQHSGVGQRVFGFSPESVFAFIPECCSGSARNPVRLHPGMLFGLPRNTQGEQDPARIIR